MKFFVNRNEFLKMLEDTFVIPIKTSSLSTNVLLEGKNNQIVSIASDLETNVKSYIENKIEKPGAVVLPIRNLIEIFRKLSQDNVKIELLEENIVAIQTENSKFKLFGMPKESFPLFPEVNIKEKISLPAVLLEEALKKVSFAMAWDDIRYILNGLLFKVEDNKITTVATDGHRLAVFHKDLEEDYELFDISFVIQNKTVNELLRLLNNKDKVNISIDKNQIIFQVDKIILVSRLLEGEYPNYKTFLKKSSDKILKIKTSNLYDSVVRAELMTTEKASIVKFILTTSEFKIIASSANLGEVEEIVNMESFQGEPLEIVLNPKYLKDALKSISSNYINLYFSQPYESVLIKTDNKEEDFNYVIMPIKMS
jgi:DNA polymerase-3 subunit beta